MRRRKLPSKNWSHWGKRGGGENGEGARWMDPATTVEMGLVEAPTHPRVSGYPLCPPGQIPFPKLENIVSPLV